MRYPVILAQVRSSSCLFHPAMYRRLEGNEGRGDVVVGRWGMGEGGEGVNLPSSHEIEMLSGGTGGRSGGEIVHVHG